jgi:hypothetical protein
MSQVRVAGLPADGVITNVEVLDLERCQANNGHR